MFKDIDVNLKLAAKQFWLGWPNPITDFTSNSPLKGDEIRLNDMKGGWDGTVDGNVTFTTRMEPASCRPSLRLPMPISAVSCSWQDGGSPVLGQVRAGAVDGASGKSMEEGSSSLTGSGGASGRYQRAAG